MTATLIREDNLIEDLPFLVGPKLYEVHKYSTCIYIPGGSPVTTCQSFCRDNQLHRNQSSDDRRIWESSQILPISRETPIALHHQPQQSKSIHLCNPSQVVVCIKLLERHLKKGQKVLIFCEDLFGLAWFAKVLRRDYIDGTTPLDTREKILDSFRKHKGGDFLLLSKVFLILFM